MKERSVTSVTPSTGVGSEEHPLGSAETYRHVARAGNPPPHRVYLHNPPRTVAEIEVDRAVVFREADKHLLLRPVVAGAAGKCGNRILNRLGIRAASVFPVIAVREVFAEAART